MTTLDLGQPSKSTITEKNSILRHFELENNEKSLEDSRELSVGLIPKKTIVFFKLNGRIISSLLEKPVAFKLKTINSWLYTRALRMLYTHLKIARVLIITRQRTSLFDLKVKAIQ